MFLSRIETSSVFKQALIADNFNFMSLELTIVLSINRRIRCTFSIINLVLLIVITIVLLMNLSSNLYLHIN